MPPWAAGAREDTRFQFGTFMWNAPLGGLDTQQQLDPAQSNHVKYALGWPGGVKSRCAGSRQPC
eukprot:7031532-Pyramimonas_sp.AAC.1